MNIQSKPEIGDWGVDLSIRDLKTNPGDDFYRYATGKWIDETEIPKDKSHLGVMEFIAKRTRDQIRELIEEVSAGEFIPGSIEQKIADLYRSYMNEEAIEQKGLQPISKQLENVAKIKNAQNLVTYFGDAVHRSDFTPIALGIDADPRSPLRQTVTITQGKLGLPNRDYFLSNAENFVAIRAEYVSYIADLLKQVPILSETPELDAEAVLALETKLAKVFWPESALRNMDLSVNPYRFPELCMDFAGMDWQNYFRASKVPVPSECIVQTPSAIKAILETFELDSIHTWQHLIIFRLLNDHAQCLPASIESRAFEFKGPILTGQSEQRPRWERAVDIVNSTLGEAVGKLYVKRHFDAHSKTLMDELVANLLEALAESIETNDWMSKDTRRAAKRKLETFTPMIGYPSKWRDFSDIEIKSEDLFGNLHRIKIAGLMERINGLDKPTDRTKWFMSPQTVNAYYHPLFNQIVFPAAILQPPFFDPHADPAVNYGAIGAIIGHEIGHGFDDQGRKFDERGRLNNWWSKEDILHFGKMSDKLVEQYGTYEALPGEYVDGRQTLGENIGDLGGVTLAYRAYRKSLANAEAPLIDDLTGNQRFFLSFGQIWKSKEREQFILMRLKSGVHSPPQYRVNGTLRNVPEWYEAFNINARSKWFLPPEKRAKFW